MEFFNKLFFLVLSLGIWMISATILTYPLKVLWNFSLFASIARLDCRASWCTLVLIGYAVIIWGEGRSMRREMK